MFSVKQPGVGGCPHCQGLGRVGDDVPCTFCNGAGEAAYESGFVHADEGTALLSPAEPLFYPADVDRALSNNAGHNWRAIDFEIDVEIRGQSYRVVHSTATPSQLEIDGRLMYSDLWG